MFMSSHPYKVNFTFLIYFIKNMNFYINQLKSFGFLIAWRRGRFMHNYYIKILWVLCWQNK